ncbi:MAG: hypothetical protein WCG85_05010 [Polyangia bacterium]
MAFPLDLYALVADLDQEQAVRALLEHRTASLGIRPCRFEARKHPQHDGGCFRHAPALLRTMQAQTEHALVVLDREGSGAEDKSAAEIEADLERRLDESGWNGRARAVVIDPETEIWLWSDSPHVAAALGWTAGEADLREWLFRQGFLSGGARKPARPKEALLAVLRKTGVKPSASIFGEAARKVSLDRCQDRSFLRFRQILQAWLPAPGA